MARPAKPMFPPEPVDEVALPFAKAAEMLGVSESYIEQLAYSRRELTVIHEGRKPRVLKSEIQARIAAQVQAARAKRMG